MPPKKRKPVIFSTHKSWRSMATDDNKKGTDAISSVMSEKRKFPPPAAFSEKARIGSMEEYETLYKAAAEDPDSYWGALPKSFTGSKSGTACSNGIPPMQNGSTAAPQTSATMPLMFTPTAGEKTKPPSYGKAKRVSSGYSPTENSTASLKVRQCTENCRNQTR